MLDAVICSCKIWWNMGENVSNANFGYLGMLIYEKMFAMEMSILVGLVNYSLIAPFRHCLNPLHQLHIINETAFNY